jgi:hypothetical protein
VHVVGRKFRGLIALLDNLAKAQTYYYIEASRLG